MGKIWNSKSLSSYKVDFILDRVTRQNAMNKEFNSWDDLDYWNSGEWQVVQERLDDLDKAHELYNPRREDLFKALDNTPFDKVKVAFYGQDPYPDRECASGPAFHIPNSIITPGEALPPTLDNIFNEYCNDLHYPRPTGTSLNLWMDRGVLLWNAIPSCAWKKSLSHDWDEWKLLTQEITQRLSHKGDIVFVFMGGIARRNVKYVDQEHNTVFETAHPVAGIKHRGRSVNLPFLGSRIFSHINDKLVQRHKSSPINWKLS